MAGSERFRPNSPRVIGEVMDDEAILIDLESGSYFSLVGTGAVVWAGVELGASVDEMVAALEQAYADVPAEAGRLVSAFLADLVAQDLVVAAEGPAPSLAADPDAVSTAVISSAGPRAFEPPALQRFDDMQELILLDPIHEVDEQEGWPRAKAPSPE